MAFALFSDNYGNPFTFSNIMLLILYPVLLGSLTYILFKPKNIFILNNWAKTMVMSSIYILSAIILLILLILTEFKFGEILYESKSRFFSLLFYYDYSPDNDMAVLKEPFEILKITLWTLFSIFIGKRMLKSRYVQGLFDVYEN